MENDKKITKDKLYELKKYVCSQINETYSNLTLNMTNIEAVEMIEGVVSGLRYDIYSEK